MVRSSLNCPLCWLTVNTSPTVFLSTDASYSLTLAPWHHFPSKIPAYQPVFQTLLSRGMGTGKDMTHIYWIQSSLSISGTWFWTHYRHQNLWMFKSHGQPSLSAVLSLGSQLTVDSTNHRSCVKFRMHGCLNLQMQSPQIQRSNWIVTEKKCACKWTSHSSNLCCWKINCSPSSHLCHTAIASHT